MRSVDDSNEIRNMYSPSCPCNLMIHFNVVLIKLNVRSKTTNQLKENNRYWPLVLKISQNYPYLFSYVYNSALRCIPVNTHCPSLKRLLYVRMWMSQKHLIDVFSIKIFQNTISFEL